VVHIDGFLNAKNPVGAILVRGGIELVAHGVELAIIVNYQWAVMNVGVAPTRHRPEVVLRYLDGGVEGFRLGIDLLQGCWFDSGKRRGEI